MRNVVQVPRWFMLVMVFGVLASLTAGAVGLVPRSPEVRSLDPTLISQADTLSLAFQQAADHIGPSVVSITSEQHFRVSRQRPSLRPQIPEEFRRFFGEDFGRFFDAPSPDQEGVRRGFGSGVIVSSDGYILTNNHVVDGADKIVVKTSNDDEFDAEIVGRDPKSDIALLKVDASGLPPAKLADAEDVNVGQWVIAVGGPFGLEKTVTAGIVSATGRNAVGIADYENFIQTDAAINPGNSGGPLVNLRGEVVGINTAIATRSGSNAGVGFSIPINMARGIMDSLKESGRVDRGYLGAIIQNLSRDLAESFNYQGEHGVLVSDVTSDGPAAEAGLKPGDIVEKLNGEVMRNASQLRNTIAAMKPGDRAKLSIYRDGKRSTIDVKIGLLDEQAMVKRDGDASFYKDLGLTVRTLTAQMAEEMGYSSDQKGVVVTEVERGGLAASAGIRPGDVIVSVNGKDVVNAIAFREVLNEAGRSEGLRLQVKTDGFSRFLFLKMK